LISIYIFKQRSFWQTSKPTTRRDLISISPQKYRSQFSKVTSFSSFPHPNFSDLYHNSRSVTAYFQITISVSILFSFFIIEIIDVWILKLIQNSWKWVYHSPSYSAGCLRRRKCVFLWSVSMPLVRPPFSISSSLEKLSPPFPPLVSFTIPFYKQW